MNELRCDGTMHGRMVDATHLEVKCGRRQCGYRPGVVVLHVFDLETGSFTTQQFADPKKGKVNGHDNAQPGTAIRAS